MACTTGCPTQDHTSWGECVRAKNFQVAGLQSLGSDRTSQKKFDQRLDLYREARENGLQPQSTSWKDSIKALESNG